MPSRGSTTPAAPHSKKPAHGRTTASAAPPIRSQGDLDARIEGLDPRALRQVSDRLDATLREITSTFSGGAVTDRGKPWDCDLVPHVFSAEDWDLLSAGFEQRLRAFEHFVRDIYGRKEILRQGVVPAAPVLGSSCHLRETAGLEPPSGHYFHLSGIRVTRDPGGQFAVKSHHFSKASGTAYMIQNRRILARVVPEFFEDADIESIAETPIQILEALNSLTTEYPGDLPPVLLSDGPSSPVYPEHSFLARRMGILIVQGHDLVALDDRIYLKSLRGLERVGVIYNRMPDALLDPLVLRRGNAQGVPGLVHCIRQGNVALINGIGSQLADDRSLLPFASSIIRFYLGERSILPSLGTFHLGDQDLLEMVLDDPGSYKVRAVIGERILSPHRGKKLTLKEERQLRSELRKSPGSYVAQPLGEGEPTICIRRGKPVERTQDHMLFALRGASETLSVFPGALTRTSGHGGHLIGHEHGGAFKDTWVLEPPRHDTTTHHQHPAYHPDPAPAMARELGASVEKHSAEDDIRPMRRITSRIADAFYWLGRYLERGFSVVSMLDVVQALEAEELNVEERRLFLPIWTRLLPRLEGKGKGSAKGSAKGKAKGGAPVRRRSIRTRKDRYDLLFNPGDAPSVIRALNNAFSNAANIQDSLSSQAWGILDDIRSAFRRYPFRTDLEDASYTRRSRTLRELILHRVPEFFMVAEDTLLADDGWRFCKIGRYLERALVTGNALVSMNDALDEQAAVETPVANTVEIQMSVFLRLLGSRDAYRRIYQMRAQRDKVLDLLWKNAEAPQSVMYSLDTAATILRAPSFAGARGLNNTLDTFDAVREIIAESDFDALLTKPPKIRLKRLHELLGETESLHTILSDSFLSHHGHLNEPSIETQLAAPR
ncbi:circularly permuted type 2 ATP-grasp protein [soil metagenome]